jgi:hypothetical protein
MYRLHGSRENVPGTSLGSDQMLMRAGGLDLFAQASHLNVDRPIVNFIVVKARQVE